MFEESTVLVLGAGASAPYGYPIGTELKDRIIKTLKRMRLEHSGWVNELDFSDKLILDFITKFEISPRPSIDSFLVYQDDEEFTELGKLAIVDVISKCENPRRIADDDWYKYFARFLYDCPFDEIGKDIGILTYNYDRSLEYYLHNSLLPSYGSKSHTECISKLNNVPLLHMYGRLDPLPWESDKGRTYGTLLTTLQLQKVSKNIKLVQEAKKGDVIHKTNRMLLGAERIYFLGLNLLNIPNLNLLDLGTLSKKTKLIGTAYDLTDGEKGRIEKYFKEKIETPGELPKFLESYIELGDILDKTLGTIRKINPF